MKRLSCRSTSTGVVFLTGALSSHCADIARALAVEAQDTRWLVAAVAGVLTERGEIEHGSAAAGMIFPTRVAIELFKQTDKDFALQLGNSTRDGSSSKCIYLRGDQDEESWLKHLNPIETPEAPLIWGGSTLPGYDLYQVASGIITRGAAATLSIKRPLVSQVASSSACRLISAIGRVTRCRGPVIHEIENMPALKLLNQSTSNLKEDQLVLLATASNESPLSSEGRALALQAIRGIDPGRGALITGNETLPGARVAFAIRDAHTARTDFNAHLNRLRRNCAGAAPQFGIFVTCMGRGESLYGSSNVDSRLISAQFPNMPFVGIRSSYQLAPLSGRLVPQVYAGVLAMCSEPS